MSHVLRLGSLTRLLRGGMDTLFPQRCGLCCVWSADSRDPFCADCQSSVDRERHRPACPFCAAPVVAYEVSDGRCGRCRGKRPPIAATISVGAYASNLGALIRRYKYRGRFELGRVLGVWLGQAVLDAPWMDRVEAIVAVPTHWRHRLGRPFYAAESLAEEVADHTGIPTAPVLRRIRGGPHQIGLDVTARKQNVRGAFKISSGVALDGARLLIIDDVKTTGATLIECARVLRDGGAQEVFAAVAVTVGVLDSDRPETLNV